MDGALAFERVIDLFAETPRFLAEDFEAIQQLTDLVGEDRIRHCPKWLNKNELSIDILFLP
jgi:hypothetical protein